jgi:hypothetical protein
MRMPYEAKRARIVLHDCRHALTELRKDPQGAEWRFRWCGTLVLLRTVGYVLKDVDAKLCPEIDEARSVWWGKIKSTKAKQEPPIFWQFIDRDRHAIVHQYVYRTGQGVTVTTGGGPTTYTYKMHGGPFDGQDPRDVVRKAIEWWDQQLTDIERDAERRVGSGRGRRPAATGRPARARGCQLLSEG